jgi:hypothetical protein
VLACRLTCDWHLCTIFLKLLSRGTLHRHVVWYRCKPVLHPCAITHTEVMALLLKHAKGLFRLRGWWGVFVQVHGSCECYSYHLCRWALYFGGPLVTGFKKLGALSQYPHEMHTITENDTGREFKITVETLQCLFWLAWHHYFNAQAHASENARE